MEEKLTAKDYITNHNYLSYSTFCRFLECEAAAKANYKPASSIAQLVGSYIDAYYSNELDTFVQEHPEIINSRTGALKNDFANAERLIERAKHDEVFNYYMSGEKQVIMTGEIEGVPFKIKMDSYKPGEFITDLKILKDFDNIWVNGRKMNIVEGYNYDIELAIFQEIVRQNTGKVLKCYLACLTKQDPADIGVFEIPQKKLDEALTIVKRNLPRIMKIRNGEIAPHRCEQCAYCRMTRKAKIMPFDLMGYSGDQLRELGYVCDDEIKEEKENGNH